MSERIKIRFRLNNSQIGGELVWAEKIDEVRYRLLNIPYYAEGYAEGDIVHCIETNNQIEVIAIEEDSGNGTLRLIFADSQRPEAQTVLDELTSVGCVYERASAGLVAVNVPPNLEIPFSQVANYLNSLSDEVLLGWEIGKTFSRSKS
jgi:hypothetical protein